MPKETECALIAGYRLGVITRSLFIRASRNTQESDISELVDHSRPHVSLTTETPPRGAQDRLNGLGLFQNPWRVRHSEKPPS